MRRNLKNTAAVALTCAAAALLVAALAVTSFTAQGQERAPSLTGSDRADEVIMARQLLMDAIDEEMQPIDLGAGRDTPLDDLKAHATRISNMMPAFRYAHMRPPMRGRF